MRFSKLNKFRKFTLIILILIAGAFAFSFFTSSCNNSLIYKPYREWRFSITRSNSSSVDTVVLRTYDEKFNANDRKVEYIYNKKPDSSGDLVSEIEQTCVIDRQGNFLSNIFIRPEIRLHPPRCNYLRFTELLPFPWIKYPIEIGQLLDWKLTLDESLEELCGKEVVGTLEVKSRIFYSNPNVGDTCWVIEGKSECKAGNFSSTYYFHEKYGFVYFSYDFNEYQIIMEPFKIIL